MPLPNPLNDVQLVVDAVIAWIREVVPALESGYDFDTPGKTGPLPDVVCECTQEGYDEQGIFGPVARVQQAGRVYAYVLEASVMASLGELGDTEAHRTAAHQLREWATDLKNAIRQDGTLGGRVQLTSRQLIIRYRPGFVEYEDGTRGREMRLELAVGELLGA